MHVSAPEVQGNMSAAETMLPCASLRERHGAPRFGPRAAGPCDKAPDTGMPTAIHSCGSISDVIGAKGKRRLSPSPSGRGRGEGQAERWRFLDCHTLS
jgi:hypothetical protein